MYPLTSGAIMKDSDKLKLMLLAWNYSLQQQAQVQGGAQGPGGQPPPSVMAQQLAQQQQQQQQVPNTTNCGSALSPSSNCGGISTTASSNGTAAPISSQSAISTANSTINNCTLTGESPSISSLCVCSARRARGSFISSIIHVYT